MFVCYELPNLLHNNRALPYHECNYELTKLQIRLSTTRVFEYGTHEIPL